MVHFLLIFDHAHGRMVHQQQFTDADRAAAAYAAAEQEHEDRAGYEVVLLGADSEETLHHTHGQYFSAVSANRASAKYLALA